MIIIILAVFAVLAFWANMTIKSTVTRYVTVTVMFIGLTLSVIAIVANMHSHFGMKTVVTTTKTEIYSAGSPQQQFGVLLYQSVGTAGKENVYIYKASPDAKKTTLAKPDLKTTSQRVAVAGDKAYKIVQTTRYVYRNNTYKFLFGWADNNHQLKHKHVIYQVPATWIAMTPDQAKSLAAKMAPKTPEEQAGAAAKQAKLAALAKIDPDRAARAQVDQIKQVLQITQ